MANRPTYEELEQRVKELEQAEFEWKQAEIGLRESEGKYHTYIEQANDGISVVHKGKLTFVNSRLAEIMGFKVDELEGKDFLQFIPKDKMNRITDYLKRRLAGEEVPQAYESRILHKDSSEIDVEFNITTIESNDEPATLTIIRDITERKQAEEALRESEMKLNTLLNATTDVAGLFDADGTILAGNDALAKSLGREKEELVDKNVAEFLLAETAERRMLILQRIVEAKKPLQWEDEHAGKFFANSVYPILDDNGTVKQIAMFAKDITESTHTQEALLSQKSFLQKAQEIGQIGTWELDIKKNKLLWTDENYRIFGLPIGTKLTYETFLDCVHPDDREYVDKEWKAAFDKKPYDIEHRLLVDGKVKWVREKAELHFNEKDECIRGTGVAQDITERKRTEEVLKERESLFSQMFEQSTTSMCFYNPDGTVNRVNDEFCKMFGVEEKVIIDAGYNVFKDQAAIDSGIIPLLRDIFEEKNTKHWEINFDIDIASASTGTPTSRTGKIFIEVFGYPVLNREGNLEYVVLQHYDITERKRAEQALKNNQNFLNRTINQSPFATWISDEKGTIIKCNAALTTFLNITAEQLIDKYNVFEDEVAIEQGLIPKIRTVFEDGKTANFSVEWDANELGYKDAKKVHIEGTMFPIHDDKGDLTNVVNHWIDISEKKLAEDQLRQSEEKYRSMMEAMKDPIYICSPDFRVEYMNPSMIQRTGHDATGEKCFKALHDLDEKCPWCMHDKAQQGEHYDLEIVSPKDNRSYHVSNSPIIRGDGSISKMTVFRDTTDLRKLEAQLQQAQKMEAVGTLAGGIAHDFNNLLMAIQGRTSIMLMKKDSSHPDIRHLKGIENNVESAAELTRQLLGFAKGGKYEARPTDLNELVKKENRMFGRTKKEITIHGKYAEDLWSVEVDRGQIEQVLLNLYINAWQAMPGGGNLYLETENVTLDEDYVKPFSIAPGRYVKISVADTGVGMDKATRERIFEPFFTTKEMGRGTGLGLASAYGIIKNHGGFINVYSEKGHGTTFNIYLPASEKEAIEEKKPAGSTLRGSETVLFVDDEDMIIEVAGELFEQLGYKVLTAGSGREAIETYEKNKEKIDIVLLDMIMPDMSGGETYDKLKEINPDIKVLLASGYSMIGTATEIMGRGCSGFIQKPFKMKELSQKLREILDEK